MYVKTIEEGMPNIGYSIPHAICKCGSTNATELMGYGPDEYEFSTPYCRR